MKLRNASLMLIVAAIVATIAFHPSFVSKAAEGQRIVIGIQKFKFVSQGLTFKPGDIVVWINKDIVPHTATAKDGSWDSGGIKPGGEWQMIVKEGTAQDYFCAFHPSMTANLDVQSNKAARLDSLSLTR